MKSAGCTWKGPEALSLIMKIGSPTALSPAGRSARGRADRELREKFCADFDYEPVTFQSSSDNGRPIYHTNVMMCVGTQFVLVGLEIIDDPGQRETVRSRLAATGKTIVALDRDQIANFAGNALELQNGHEKLLVLSVRAASHLRAA